MVLTVYSIYDEKGKLFGNPFQRTNDGLALRDFGDLVNDIKSSVNKHPEDYKLYKLGTFDDNSGMFESAKQPVYMCKATDYLNNVA